MRDVCFLNPSCEVRDPVEIMDSESLIVSIQKILEAGRQVMIQKAYPVEKD